MDRKNIEYMYSTHELCKILNLTVEGIWNIKKKTKIKFLKKDYKKYYNLEDFIPYKYYRNLPFNKRKYNKVFVRSLDETTPYIYYGIDDEEEIKINVLELFDIKEKDYKFV